ncbi:hypothetical protein A9Q73_06980 [Bermanella sp. 47_1433_sub80_T6]|nr:hypothetical protein A9Q73_06980 [Bermanella sp. 47_1433_sub80_T6]
MNNTSDSVVSQYLDSLLLDLTLSEPELKVAQIPAYIAQDSVVMGQRLVPCFDPFLFMEVKAGHSRAQHWLMVLMMLQLCGSLPAGRLKNYCLRQCQTLLNNCRLTFP